MLPWCGRRWTLEFTFEEARAHLGLETQRQWNDRHCPHDTRTVMFLYSIITLTAHRLIDQERPA
jgi:hypothetical protein